MGQGTKEGGATGKGQRTQLGGTQGTVHQGKGAQVKGQGPS